MDSCKDISLLVIKDLHVNWMNEKERVFIIKEKKAYKRYACIRHAVCSWWSW